MMLLAGEMCVREIPNRRRVCRRAWKRAVNKSVGAPLLVDLTSAEYLLLI